MTWLSGRPSTATGRGRDLETEARQTDAEARPRLRQDGYLKTKAIIIIVIRASVGQMTSQTRQGTCKKVRKTNNCLPAVTEGGNFKTEPIKAEANIMRPSRGQGQGRKAEARLRH